MPIRCASFLVVGAALIALLLAVGSGAQTPDSFRFAILGDRTGEAQPEVYEQIWKEIAAEHPAFVVGVGDTIQGMNDTSAEKEWREANEILKPFRNLTTYLAAGNHDIWSSKSEGLFRQYTGHPAHYSFDYDQAHVTILDNSRSDELSSQELSFLESDLKAHKGQAIKVIVSHRPSWLLNVAFQNPNFALHQLAKRYGVKYVIAGHIHQLLHFELEGVTYLSMPSSGGHLRLSKAYNQGWFFGHALVEAHGENADFQIKEAAKPAGEGRMTKLTDWGMTGLVLKDPVKAPPAK